MVVHCKQADRTDPCQLPARKRSVEHRLEKWETTVGRPASSMSAGVHTGQS